MAGQVHLQTSRKLPIYYLSPLLSLSVNPIIIA